MSLEHASDVSFIKYSLWMLRDFCFDEHQCHSLKNHKLIMHRVGVPPQYGGIEIEFVRDQKRSNRLPTTWIRRILKRNITVLFFFCFGVFKTRGACNSPNFDQLVNQQSTHSLIYSYIATLRYETDFSHTNDFCDPNEPIRWPISVLFARYMNFLPTITDDRRPSEYSNASMRVTQSTFLAIFGIFLLGSMGIYPQLWCVLLCIRWLCTKLNNIRNTTYCDMWF